ncbi:MAG TPA: hypothetical protein VN381_13050 [Anaerovoracaceae bacterium]|nr:hypothetical protein [Anaerovoracaceae bacterium]
MKKILKRAAAFGLGAVLMIFVAACSNQLDVVGDESIETFQAVLEVIPDNVSADDLNGGWSLEAPDDTVRFIWSKDYSKSPLHDVMLEFDAKPFLDAGLDTDKLPEGITYFEDKLMVGTKLGSDAFKYDGEATPLASYEQIVRSYRDSIGYHTALDHFGVKLGDGNMFEWAKTMSTNDKDIVFVLNPEPFISAGVDPDAVSGWVFAKVPVEENGKTVEVDKLLKPFDLQ